MRATLQDLADSRVPQSIGLCSGDLPRLASYANQAIQELILAAPETGWSDGWAKIAINVSCADPYITLPSEFCRLVNLDVCRFPLPIFTEWYETLEAGIGLQGPLSGRYGCGLQAAFERANVTTVVDLPPENNYVRCYLTDSRDINKRIIFTGAKDQNLNPIYSTDVAHQINGFPLVFDQPFVTSPFIVTSFTGVQKDVTYGDIIVKAVNATTSEEIQLARYSPTDTRPTYRRYYLQAGCRFHESEAVTRRVTAMAKYEFRPVSQPTDFLLIGNIPALKAKIEAIRFAEMDSPTALQMSAAKHAGAIRILNHELASYHSEKPAINLAMFGTAKLERVNIGMM